MICVRIAQRRSSTARAEGLENLERVRLYSGICIGGETRRRELRSPSRLPLTLEPLACAYTLYFTIPGASVSMAVLQILFKLSRST